MRMLKRVTVWGFAAICALCFTGCSLLKVSVSTGDPLSKAAMNTRTLTRGFYYDFASVVERAADSIVATSDNPRIRIAAVQWKIRATRAGIGAAMQSIPDVALADLWILCRRMDTAFAETPDSLLFGAQSPIARSAAHGLDRKIARLAKQTLTADRYELMSAFVDDYLAAHPVTNGDSSENTTLAWIEFLRAHGIEESFATGSISEVLADVNDRVSGQTQQLSNSLGWSKDIWEMRLGQDSLRSQLGARLDSLDRGFTRMVIVAEHLPEISDAVMRDLNAQATQLVRTMNAMADQLFADIDRQRSELQQYLSGEREELIGQFRSTANELLQAMMDALPSMIGKVLFYLVLALLVLFGAPFALGFWLGGVRERLRTKKEAQTRELHQRREDSHE